MEIKSVIQYNNPSNKEEWDLLAQSNGNLLQSSFYDDVQSFYQQKAIYVELFFETNLIGGVKLFYYESNKFPWLHRQLTIFGDFILKNKTTSKERTEIQVTLLQNIETLITNKRVTFFKFSSYYGNYPLLFDKPKIFTKKWGIAYLDIDKSEQDLYKGIHVKHRNMINKARKNNIIFEVNNDIDLFLNLLHETYKNQDVSKPNDEYIRHLFDTLVQNQKATIYFTKNKEGKYLSGALIQEYGDVADYTFGGNLRNNLGAGQYLQFNIFLTLKKKGIKRYYLGQVATNEEKNNIKFTEGITRFKKRFGTELNSGVGMEIVCNKIKYKLWKILLKLIKMK